MEESQITYFETILTEQLNKLLIQADLALSELATENNQEIEPVDRASLFADQSLKLRIKSRESRLIKKVIQALERIADGSYGICEDCGENITIKRLEARPVTTKCIDCKEHEERLEILVK